MSTPSLITLGKIGRTYGIKGWFHVNSYAEDPASLFNYPIWHLKDHHQWQSVELEAYRAHGKGYIAKLKGYDTPEVVRLLTNREIGIPHSELPKTAANEYYWSDLIGLEVYTPHKAYLGKVTQVFATGANDVLCVQAERERLIPFIESVIQEVDLKQQRIIVDWDAEF